MENILGSMEKLKYENGNYAESDFRETVKDIGICDKR